MHSRKPTMCPPSSPPLRPAGVLKPPSVAPRRRGPDLSGLPRWLVSPVRTLVRSRPPMAAHVDSCERPVFDWDAWACGHLARSYWDPPSTGDRASWLSCVRVWAAARAQGGPQLLARADNGRSSPSHDALVRAVVTATVAETLAHRHGADVSRLDVRVRRHINTTAGRQRGDAPNKLTLFHVVCLAIARFDFDVAQQRTPRARADALAVRTRQRFDELHALAAAARRGAAPTRALRLATVQLANALKTELRYTVHVPWYSALVVPGAMTLELIARAFVTGLVAPGGVSAGATPLGTWLVMLRHPAHSGRWAALVRFLTGYYQCAAAHIDEKSREYVTFVIMFTLLHAVKHESICEGEASAAAIASTHGRAAPLGDCSLRFRELLDFYLDGNGDDCETSFVSESASK